ncbi:MAG: phospholipase D family protein [Deltaproteobacteria bacterium]|nr:phospholipase D family protein [Deltaproteobacteria bacterium]
MSKMNRSPRSVLPLICCLAILLLAAPLQAQKWAVYFSPHGGATEAITTAVNQARTSIHVQAYSLSSRPIIKAIIAAQARGVRVHVILDQSQRRFSGLAALLAAGVPTWLDAGHQIAHNKIMIIDGETVITGSFNFTRSAEEYNAENLLVVHDKALAARFETNFQAHLAHSSPVR